MLIVLLPLLCHYVNSGRGKGQSREGLVGHIGGDGQMPIRSLQICNGLCFSPGGGDGETFQNYENHIMNSPKLNYGLFSQK